MLRWLTAGESHGPALVAILEGLPAGRAGHHRRHRDRPGATPARLRPRGADEVRAGRGHRPRRRPARPDPRRRRSPIQVGNTEWPKWETGDGRRPGRPGRARRPGPQRAADPSPARARRPGRACRSTASTTPGRCSSGPAPGRPRPGSPSARWPGPSSRQVAGAEVAQPRRRARRRDGPGRRACPQPDDVGRIDADPVRCLDPDGQRRDGRPRSTRPARTATPSAGSSRSSSTGCRPGLGSHVHWDRRLDSRLAARADGDPGHQGRRGRRRVRAGARPAARWRTTRSRPAADGVRRRSGRSGRHRGRHDAPARCCGSGPR